MTLLKVTGALVAVACLSSVHAQDDAGCTYTSREMQRLRLPSSASAVPATNAQQCAGIAASYGLTSATFDAPDGGAARCFLSSAAAAQLTFEVSATSTALLDIACEGASPSLPAQVQLTEVDVETIEAAECSAEVARGVQVLGSSLASHIITDAAGCIKACASYASACAVAVHEAAAEDTMARCLLFGETARGIEAAGVSAYKNIQCGGDSSVPVTATEGPLEPVVEEEPAMEQPPVEQPPVEQPPVEQPPVEQPPAVEEEPEPTPAAPVTPVEPVAPANQCFKSAESFLYELATEDGLFDCPRPGTANVPAGKPPTELTPPEGTDMTQFINSKGKIDMKFAPISAGGAYCSKSKSDPNNILFGGTVMFKEGSKCRLAPTKANGDACCFIRAWQPSAEGLYYDNCSMQQGILGGTWWVESEMAGNEAIVGWGADPEPHIHYEVDCNGCDGMPDKRYYNKFYLGNKPSDLCQIERCGGPTPEDHGSEMFPLGAGCGEKTAYVYHLVIDKTR